MNDIIRVVGRFQRSDVKGVTHSEQKVQGFTIRDYFAAAALQGMSGDYGSYEEAARVAYAYADAMMEARAKK